MKIKFIPVIAAIALLSSCAGDGNGNASDAESDAVKDALQEELLNESATENEEIVDQVFFLPSALQIGSVFQKSGLKYMEGVTNDPTIHDSYVSQSSKVLNFGVYSADLAYAILNGQTQKSIELMSAVKNLAPQIGLGEVFQDESTMRRFEENISNQDSVLNVLVDIQTTTDIFVDENNLHHITHIVFAGAWAEGMYLGVKASNTSNKEAVASRLVEQMAILNNLNKALASNKNQTAEINAVMATLSELESRFDEITNAGSSTSLRNLDISKEDMDWISEKVIDLRTRIVTETLVSKG